ncbi:MAG: hypothetical protein N7Q72_04030, partial [Spiroplasma sp. Tabriz.8]|nr:hypothetical protein [Spiroplasma sp. Tabriz.8]
NRGDSVSHRHHTPRPRKWLTATNIYGNRTPHIYSLLLLLLLLLLLYSSSIMQRRRPLSRPRNSFHSIKHRHQHRRHHHRP